jgi:hypothetical protein
VPFGLVYLLLRRLVSAPPGPSAWTGSWYSAAATSSECSARTPPITTGPCPTEASSSRRRSGGPIRLPGRPRALASGGARCWAGSSVSTKWLLDPRIEGFCALQAGNVSRCSGGGLRTTAAATPPGASRPSSATPASAWPCSRAPSTGAPGATGRPGTTRPGSRA